MKLSNNGINSKIIYWQIVDLTNDSVGNFTQSVWHCSRRRTRTEEPATSWAVLPKENMANINNWQIWTRKKWANKLSAQIINMSMSTERHKSVQIASNSKESKRTIKIRFINRCANMRPLCLTSFSQDNHESRVVRVPLQTENILFAFETKPSFVAAKSKWNSINSANWAREFS